MKCTIKGGRVIDQNENNVALIRTYGKKSEAIIDRKRELIVRVAENSPQDFVPQSFLPAPFLSTSTRVRAYLVSGLPGKD